jgi:hypothetical protein
MHLPGANPRQVDLLVSQNDRQRKELFQQFLSAYEIGPRRRAPCSQRCHTSAGCADTLLDCCSQCRLCVVPLPDRDCVQQHICPCKVPPREQALSRSPALFLLAISLLRTTGFFPFAPNILNGTVPVVAFGR